MSDNVTPIRPADPEADAPPAEPTHIRLVLPLGCFVHSAGDYHVVQYVATPGEFNDPNDPLRMTKEPVSAITAFHRFTGAQMPYEEMEILKQPMQPAEERRHIKLVGKDGKPLKGVKDAPAPKFELAKPGNTMMGLLNPDYGPRK